MQQNRSMPATTVIPVLAYPSVPEAVAWLAAAFGFTLRLGIGDHRAQLNAGDGAIVIIGGAITDESRGGDSIMVRVEDARAHCDRAAAHGATIAMTPIASTMAIDAGFLCLMPGLDWYVGCSGVLHGAMAAGICERDAGSVSQRRYD